MSLFQESADLPDSFAGIVRLFPLPNLVLFPHAVQALHIFEPRYRELLEDALAGDQLITMALLQPGWEPGYEGRPPVFASCCVGRVVTHVRQEDGRYNILLHGLKRATVLRELPPQESFRLAEVTVQEDIYPATGVARRAQIQRELLECFRRFLPDSPATREQFEQLFSRQLPLGILTDVVAFTMPLDLDFKRQLLVECNVDLRAQQLLARLEVLAEQPVAERGLRPFPPDFSNN